MSKTLPRVYVPLDTDDLSAAIAMAEKVIPPGCGLKLGMEFFNANGPQGIEAIRSKFPDVSLFIDLKYHDIPNTVAGALRSITRLAPDYLNVHASGGLEMMKTGLIAMREEADKLGIKTPKLLGVTVLTSLDEAALMQVGQSLPMEGQVKRLAMLTKMARLDGVVCSSHEIKTVRAACGGDFILMVPGIRLAESGNNDQKRVMTPKEAVDLGATHLVIGRPITQAAEPTKAARDILATLEMN